MSLGAAVVDLDGSLTPLRGKLNTGKSEVTSWMGGLESMVKSATSTMFGVLAADLVRNVANLGQQFVVAGFQAASQYQQTFYALNTMVEQELMRGTKKVVQAGKVRQGLTEKEAKELAQLQAGLQKETDQRDALALRVQKGAQATTKSATELERERLQRAQLSAQIAKEKNERAELARKYGEHSYQVRQQDLAIQVLQTRLASVGMTKTQTGALDQQIDAQQRTANQHRLAEANSELDADKKRIAQLIAKRDTLVDVTKTIREGGMSADEAATAATEKTLELMDWAQDLAIFSPFSREDVAQSLKLGAVYGFTLEQAKALTQGMVDFTAAAGMPGYEIEAMTRSMGQMRSEGKITERELRELARRGLPIYELLSEVTGRSQDELKKVKELSGDTAREIVEKLIPAIGARYKGKARGMTETLPGIATSFQDLAAVNLSNFFAGRTGKGGLFGPLLGDMSKLVDFLNSPALRAKIIAWGEQIGIFLRDKIVNPLKGLGAWIAANAVPAFKRLDRALMPVKQSLNWLLDIGGKLKKAFDLGNIQTVFDQAGWMFKNFDANAEMQKLVAGIAEWMKTNSPISGEQFGKWARDFWAWIWDPKGGAIAKIADTFTGLFIGIHTWLQGEDGQKNMRGTGRFIGESIVTAIGGAFGLAEPGGSGANLASALIQFLLDVAGAVAWVIGDIGTELWLALLRAFYRAMTGTEMTEEFQNHLRQLPRIAIGNLFNAEMWLEGARNMLRALLTAIKQVFGAAGENIKTAIDDLIPDFQLNIRLPGRARGGPVSAYQPYLVGERGPELFVPRASGTIVSHAAMRDAAASADNRRMENHFYITSNDPQQVARMIDQRLEQLRWA